MWDTDENTEVSHQSGLSRLCGSFCTAFILAPLVILLSCFALGWNEKRAVCDSRAVAEGHEAAVPTGCGANRATGTAMGNGDLVLVSCDLKPDGLPLFTPAGDFAPVLQFHGVGLKTEALIYQCVEKSHSTTKKDHVGGGKTKVTTYTYERQWVTSHVDSSHFRKRDSDSYRRNCGVDNPTWPPGAPQSTVQRAPSAMVGAYTIPQSPFLDSIPLDAPLAVSSVPAGWMQNGVEYTKGSTQPNNLGAVKVTFHGNDWNKKSMTVLGLNSGGQLGRWTASNSWMCSGFTLARLRMGLYTKDEFFDAMEAETSEITWILRVVFLVVLWMGFCCLFEPLEVMADCIPCIGPYLGDSISCIVGCVTCPVAFACGLGVAGVVWVLMRPLVGLGLLFGFFLIVGATWAVSVRLKNMREEKKRLITNAPGAGGYSYS